MERRGRKNDDGILCEKREKETEGREKIRGEKEKAMRACVMK